MNEANTGPRDPFIQKQVEDLFRYVEDTENNFGALFAAVAYKEDIHVPSDEEQLAGVDSITERGKLQIDQDIAGFQFQHTLDAAGLTFSANVFSGQLCITDGERFVKTLRSIPESSELLKEGMGSILKNFISSVASQYLPNPLELDKDVFETFHYNPQVQADAEDDPKGERARMTVEALMHADDIVEQLERLGVHKNTLRAFKALRTAELENMVPEWAVAMNWQLFTPPTESCYDAHWTQWYEENNWQAYFEYLNSAWLKAPSDSKFMALVTNGVDENIAKLINGELEPTEHAKLAATTTAEYDDDFLDPYDAEEERRQFEKWQKDEYHPMLNGVRQRLQNYRQTAL